MKRTLSLTWLRYLAARGFAETAKGAILGFQNSEEGFLYLQGRWESLDSIDPKCSSNFSSTHQAKLEQLMEVLVMVVLMMVVLINS